MVNEENEEIYEIEEELLKEIMPKRFRKEKTIEDREIENWVFDKPTLLALAKLVNKGYLSELTSTISMGKEAFVFKGKDSAGFPVAVKIYKKDTTLFKDMIPYIDGDPRFRHIRKKRSHIIYLWCQKEFKNLQEFYEAGVPVPKPYAYRDNILVMEFIGIDDLPAPRLKDVLIENPKEFMESLINDIKTLYENGFVHADMSEYNVLMRGEDNYVIIDVGQGVPLSHPMAYRWVVRDIINVVNYFKRRYKLDVDHKKYVIEVLGEDILAHYLGSY